MLTNYKYPEEAYNLADKTKIKDWLPSNFICLYTKWYTSNKSF
jgi:hypothetical protein